MSTVPSSVRRNKPNRFTDLMETVAPEITLESPPETDTSEIQGAGLSATQNPETPTIPPSGILEIPDVVTNGTNNGIANGAKIGRPTGKRSNPGFSQLTAYIPEQLHREVKHKVLDLPRKTDPVTGRPRQAEISDVVEELLRMWVSGELPERPRL